MLDKKTVLAILIDMGLHEGNTLEQAAAFANMLLSKKNTERVLGMERVMDFVESIDNE